MAQFNDILKEIEKSIQNFNRKIPSTQKDVLAGIEEELRNLDLDGGKIKATVKNLSLIARIKNKLAKIILTDDYKADVKNFAESFNEITRLQNTYWKQVEAEFKPRPLLREIKNITIADTVNKLMESGINSNLVDPVSDILRTNITAGGSYRDLTDQLKQALTDTNTPGLLSRYTKSTTIDSINSYSAQYAQVVSSDLGFEWYKYSNTDIETTRPFCDALTDRPFFHVSEIPQLLRAEGLTYVNKKGQRVSVPIYSKTGLPHGMKDGTSPDNFLTNRGGWNCGHQCRPVSEGLVPQADKDRVFSSPGYLRWKSSQTNPTPQRQPEPVAPQPTPEPIIPTPSPVPSESFRAQLETKNQPALNQMEKAGYNTHRDLLGYLPSDDLKIEFTGRGRGSYYDPSQKKVVIAARATASEGMKDKVIAHELAHAIHFQNNIISYAKVDPKFDQMYDGLKSSIKGKGLEVQTALGNLAKKQIEESRNLGVKWDATDHTAMSDVLGSLTRGVFGGGHAKSYYKKGNMAKMEVFAHAVEFIKNKNVYEDAHPILKEISKSMKEYISETLESIRK